ncbi:hypothetical protein [Bifidobacterium phasiani]|uniref:Uncharacterized protein n=1 Tax=Bifidobacterium phasiani TaxID=2834431 RepID=A0ABS6W816_9BIFI|nr:hypothetical protein [Bifidobacterium phasiani]MBW3082639.1 hypothetical protein [Bifidobacterium phasiani]
MHKTYRRRQGGVSFRLVTAVAAVAMLATSAIAGTAFAADETGGDRIIRDAIQADSPDPGTAPATSPPAPPAARCSWC